MPLTLPTNEQIVYDPANVAAGSNGGVTNSIAQLRAHIQQSIALGLEGATTVASGVVTPPTIPSSSPAALYPVFRISGEGDVADTVTKFDLTDLVEYMPFRVSIAGADQPITFLNDATEDPGDTTGDIETANGEDITLSNTKQWLEFRRVGSKIEQVGSQNSSGVNNPASAPMNGGGQIVYNFRPATHEVTGTAYTINSRDDSANASTRDTNGIELIATGADSKVFTLPAGGDLAVNDSFMWSQNGAGNVTFQAASGGAIVNAYGYDTSAGDGATGFARVMETSPTVKWQLVGDLGSVSADAASRTWVSSLSTGIAETDAGSTAFKDAVALAHTPSDDTDWVYFARGYLEADSTNSSNTGVAQLLVAGTVRPSMTRPRYNIHQDAVSFVWPVSYGTSPGLQTIKLQMNADATYQTRISKPGLIGVQLGANESFAVETGQITNSTDTMADVITHTTGTLPAGDYVIIAGTEFTLSNVDNAEFVVQVDGSEVAGSKRIMERNGPGAGYYAYSYKVALSNAAHTIKIRQRRTGAANVTSENASIIVMSAAAFKEVHYAENQAESSISTSTGYGSRVNGSFALLDGWDYLLLANAGVFMNASGSSDSVDVRVTRNGGALLDEVNAGTRTSSRYSPNGILAPFIVSRQSATDTFAIEKKSSADNVGHQMKGASILLVALAPTAS